MERWQKLAELPPPNIHPLLEAFHGYILFLCISQLLSGHPKLLFAFKEIQPRKHGRIKPTARIITHLSKMDCRDTCGWQEKQKKNKTRCLFPVSKDVRFSTVKRILILQHVFETLMGSTNKIQRSGWEREVCAGVRKPRGRGGRKMRQKETERGR